MAGSLKISEEDILKGIDEHINYNKTKLEESQKRSRTVQNAAYYALEELILKGKIGNLNRLRKKASENSDLSKIAIFDYRENSDFDNLNICYDLELNELDDGHYKIHSKRNIDGIVVSKETADNLKEKYKYNFGSGRLLGLGLYNGKYLCGIVLPEPRASIQKS